MTRQRAIMLLGLVLFLLFGWWAIYHSFARAEAIEAKLERRANQAVMDAGVGFARVEMRGQRAVVTGVPSDAQARLKALSAVRASTWSGGLALGGVTRVDDKMGSGTPAPAYGWSAIRAPGRITLAGKVPSADARQALLAQARDLFASIRVVDDMQVAPGAPEGDWIGMARFGLQRIRDLPDGEAEIADSKLVIRGTARNAAEADALTQAMYALPKPWTWENAVVAPMEIPEISGIDLTEASSQECQQSLAEIMAKNTITFETGKAVLRGDSIAVLDKLVYVAKRCQSFRIDITGHTDNIGPRETNMVLSRTRAEAVAQYLISKGVGRDRLSTQGYGPDRPATSNATLAGQAQNRRIEFSVRT